MEIIIQSLKTSSIHKEYLGIFISLFISYFNTNRNCHFSFDTYVFRVTNKNDFDLIYKQRVVTESKAWWLLALCLITNVLSHLTETSPFITQKGPIHNCQNSTLNNDNSQNTQLSVSIFISLGLCLVLKLTRKTYIIISCGQWRVEDN